MSSLLRAYRSRVWSRGTVPHVVGADPLADPAAYAAELMLLAQRERIDLLLPLTDPSTEAVLEHRAALPRHIALPFPDLATYRRASDKAGVRTWPNGAASACPHGGSWRTLPRPAARLPDAAFFPAFVQTAPIGDRL